MSARPALTPVQVQEARSLYAQGLSSVQIADRYGVAHHTAMKAIPVSDRRPPRRATEMSDAQCDELVERYQAGTDSVQGLAATFKIGRSRVKSILAAANVEIRPRGKTLRQSQKLAEKDIADDYRAGQSGRALAKKYGCTEKAIRQVLEKQEVKMRPAGSPKALSDEQRERAREMRGQGWRAADLAAHFGVTITAIRKAVRGVPVPKAVRRASATPQVPADELISGFQQGATVAELARRHHMEPKSVSAVLRDAGIQIRRGRQSVDLPVDELVERARQGATTAELAELYGVSTPTIRSRLKEAGA